MYYIEIGLKDRLGRFAKPLALIFAGAAALCTLGTGNLAQANSISDVLLTSYNVPVIVTGIGLSALVLLIIVGGLKRIANVTATLVPFMAVLYFLSAAIVIGVHWRDIPGAMGLIVRGAFNGTAATGGFVGSTFIMTLVWGVRRGLFSNEAGQGSAPMAMRQQKLSTPCARVCGIARTNGRYADYLYPHGSCGGHYRCMVIGHTGSRNDPRRISGRYGKSWTWHALEAYRYRKALLFAFSTIIAWSYYGSRAIQYIISDRGIKPYYFVFGLFTFFGAVWGINWYGVLWTW